MTAIDESPATKLTVPRAGMGRPLHGRHHPIPRPDPEIMRDHSIAPRSDLEEIVLAEGVDRMQVERIRKRIAGALDEGYEMCEAQGAAPGAKWGDLTTAIYTAAGDVAYLSCHGVIAFSAILHHPIRYINKYWKNEPTVGVNPGDGLHSQRCSLRQRPQHRPVDDHADHARRRDHRLGGGHDPRGRETVPASPEVCRPVPRRRSTTVCG